MRVAPTVTVGKVEAKEQSEGCVPNRKHSNFECKALFSTVVEQRITFLGGCTLLVLVRNAGSGVRWPAWAHRNRAICRSTTFIEPTLPRGNI